MAAVYAEECTDRRVDARHLHRDEAEQLLATARAAVTLKAEPANAELLERRQQFERNASSDQYLLMIGWTLVSI